MFDVQVDDILKHNKANVDKLFKMYSTKKAMTIEDSENMLEKAQVDLDEASVLRCFTLSRTLVADELADRV